MDSYSDYPMGDEKSYQNKKKHGSPVHPNSSAAKHAKARKEAMAKKMPVPSRYKGNSHSEGGIPFGKPPKGEK